MDMDLGQIRKQILCDPILLKLSNLAKVKEIPLFLVGGYIRNLLLGMHRKDYDFTLPKESSSFLPVIEETLDFRFFKVGKEEMDTVTHRIIKKGMSFDLTFLQGKTI